jgi:glycosyltransferase involved in cell wall biosynthesis
MTPLISIIIPTYNRAKYVTRAIDAIRNQAFTEWELIVVDDGSSDETSSVVRAISELDSRVILIVQKNEGVSQARCTGMAAMNTSSKYLLFHDDDDWLVEDALTILTNGVLSHPTAPAVIGFARHCDAVGMSDETIKSCFGSKRMSVSKAGLVSFPKMETPESVATLSVWCSIATPGQVLIRRSAFEQTRGFLTECQPSDDWLLWLELASIGDLPRLCAFTLNKLEHVGAVNKNSSMMEGAEEAVRVQWLRKQGISPQERLVSLQGYLLSSLANASWAVEDFRNRNMISGIKQVYRTMKRIVRIGRFWAMAYRMRPITEYRA